MEVNSPSTGPEVNPKVETTKRPKVCLDGK